MLRTTARQKRGKHYSAAARTDFDVTSRRQPRPQPRRQGTRSGVLAAALKES